MLRRSLTGSSVAMSTPSMEIVPLVGSTIRLIMRSRVVFPEPEDPTRTVVLREGRTRLKSSTARAPSGNCLDTESNSIIEWLIPRMESDQHKPDNQPNHCSEPQAKRIAVDCGNFWFDSLRQPELRERARTSPPQPCRSMRLRFRSNRGGSRA